MGVEWAVKTGGEGSKWLAMLLTDRVKVTGDVDFGWRRPGRRNREDGGSNPRRLTVTLWVDFRSLLPEGNNG